MPACAAHEEWEAPAGLVETWLHHVGRSLSDQEIEDISPPFVAAKGALEYRKAKIRASRANECRGRVAVRNLGRVDLPGEGRDDVQSPRVHWSRSRHRRGLDVVWAGPSIGLEMARAGQSVS